MKLRQLILLFVIILSLSVNAQQTSINTDKKFNQTKQIQAKLSAGQSLKISPNPVLTTNPILIITAVNVEIFSYLITNSVGQIVELENLAGKPDLTIIDLTDAVTLGTYIIRFETSSGGITRKFSVI